jgi:hypothetical protein
VNPATVQLVVGLVQALAWPVCIMFLAFVLRGPLGELIGRVKSLEHGATKVSFEEELQGLRSRAEPTSEPPPAAEEDPVQKLLERLRALATESPKLCVLESWNAAMDALVTAARAKGLRLDDKLLEKPRLLAEKLRDAGHLDAQAAEAFIGLRLLRNKVAHAENMAVSARDASAYVDMVSPLLRWAAGIAA